MRALADIFGENRERYTMASRSAGIGGPAGTAAIGDRPGMSGGAGVRAWDSPTGRAHVFAVAAFLGLVFLHIASENRTA